MRRVLVLSMLVLLSGCAPQVDEPRVEAPPTSRPTETASADPSPEPEVEAPVDLFGSVAVSEECASVFDLPLRTGDSSDWEFALNRAVFSCATADEWASVVYFYPDALGVAGLDDQYVAWALQAACADFDRHEARACVDAVGRGLFPRPGNWPA